MSYWTILTVTDSDKHFAPPIDEYLKRLGKKIQIHTIKPQKHGQQDHIRQQETERIHDALARITKKEQVPVILLSLQGETRTTSQWVDHSIHHNTCVVVIGGPYGIQEEQLSWYVTHKVALGAQTMPHGLAKLVLLEQIYRIDMIEQGRTYHY